VVVDGTGEFEGAAGSFVSRGRLNYVTGEVFLRYNGQLTFE